MRSNGEKIGSEVNIGRFGSQLPAVNLTMRPPGHDQRIDQLEAPGQTDHGRHGGGPNRRRDTLGLLAQAGNQLLCKFVRLDVAGVFELTPEPRIDRERSTDIPSHNVTLDKNTHGPLGATE
jgi:hypothetical protein